MPTKMVSLAVRVPHEDAEFISQLKVEGATTPSDKMRSIISDARRRHQGTHDFKKSLELTNSFLEPVFSKIRELEIDNGMHSELIIRSIEWLPEVMAFIMSRQSRLEQEEDAQRSLTELENGIAERVFRLIESVLQMGVTKRSPCYNTDTVLERADPILELTRVIEQTLDLWNKEKVQ